MTMLHELAAMLDAATGPSRELDWRIEHIVVRSPVFDASSHDFWPPFMVNSRADKGIPRYTASIDAALALVERLLPGWEWDVELNQGVYFCTLIRLPVTADEGMWCADAPTAPLAILKAMVAALMEREAEHGR